MTLQTVVPELFREFPALRMLSEKTLSEYSDEMPDAYPVFSDILRPTAFSALDRGDFGAVRSYFTFYERVASDPDKDVSSLSHIELIEQLANDPDRLRTAWPYMGPSTRRQARDYAAALKRQFGEEIRLPE